MVYSDALLVLMAAVVVKGQFFPDPIGRGSCPGLGFPGPYLLYPGFPGGIASRSGFPGIGASGFVPGGVNGNGGVAGGPGGLINGGMGGIGGDVGGLWGANGIRGIGRGVAAGLGDIEGPGISQETEGSDIVGGLEGAAGGLGGRPGFPGPSLPHPGFSERVASRCGFPGIGGSRFVPGGVNGNGGVAGGPGGLPGFLRPYLSYPGFSRGIASRSGFPGIGGSRFVPGGVNGNGGVAGGPGGLMNGGLGGGAGIGLRKAAGLTGDVGPGRAEETEGLESVGGNNGAGGGPGGLTGFEQFLRGLALLGGSLNPSQTMGLLIPMRYPSSYGPFGGFPIDQMPGIADNAGPTGAFDYSQSSSSYSGSCGSFGVSPGANGYQGNGYSGSGSQASSSGGCRQNDESQGGFSNGNVASSLGPNSDGSSFFCQPCSSFGKGFPGPGQTFLCSPYSSDSGPQIDSCSSSFNGQNSFPQTNVEQASVEPGTSECHGSSRNQQSSCTPEPSPVMARQSPCKNVCRRSSLRTSRRKHGFNCRNRCATT